MCRKIRVLAALVLLLTSFQLVEAQDSTPTGGTLNMLLNLLNQGTITAEQMKEAIDIFSQLESNSELQALYRDLAAGEIVDMSEFERLAALVRETLEIDTLLLEEFESARREGTVDAWVDFLIEAWKSFREDHPLTELVEDARRNLEDARDRRIVEDETAILSARNRNTEAAWELYLRDFPDGANVPEAIRNIQLIHVEEANAYVDTRNLATLESFNNFVSDHPGSPLAELAQLELDELQADIQRADRVAYEQAVDVSTLELWLEYLENFSDGDYRTVAAERVDELRATAADDEAYAAATLADTVESYEAYLVDYQNGAYSEAAIVRINQLGWAEFADVTFIPGNTFEMGASNGRADERPAHNVQIDAFHMGRTEVTNEQYRRFLGDITRNAPQPPDFSQDYMSQYPNLPVVNVTFGDAQAFAGWLSEKIGLMVRLPTEAEWEFAARGGRNRAPYPWGRDDPEDRARYNGNDPNGIKTIGKNDQFGANEFGLFNMAGNVREWVGDVYNDDYFENLQQPVINPTGPETGPNGERVIRGGSWDTGDDQLRVSRREKSAPSETDDDIGFRIVIKDLQPQGQWR